MNKEMLKEDRVHGDVLYPANVYEVRCKAGEPLLDLHWHDELEFLTVTEGKALFRLDVEELVVSAGEALFMNSGVLHSGATLENDTCSFTAFVFHVDLLGSHTYDRLQELYIDPVVNRNRLVPVHLTPAFAEHKPILEQLQELNRLNTDKPPAYELVSKGLLYLIFAALYKLGQSQQSPAKSAAEQVKLERLKKTLNYIQNHYNEPIRLHDLAAETAMNESYFCRFFKEMTGKTPMDFLNQYRVQKAAALVQAGGKKLTEIALDVGFHNVSYFIGVFKRHFGCTPSQYQKRGHHDEQTE
ncbi:helix-turn-helix domain-containing protein [Paenibacillus tarimensis]